MARADESDNHFAAPDADGSTVPPPSSAAFLARTSLFLAAATLVSRILGFVREMLIARYYGSTGGTDALFFSLNIAEALRTIIIAGAVSSVFIPLMTETQRSGKAEDARRLAWHMLVFVSWLAAAVVLLAELGAPWIVKATQYLSFSREPIEPERFSLTVGMMRIMLPVILLVTLWGLMGGILNSYDNFTVPALAPLIWNITIIAVPIIYGDRERITDVAVAWVVGHFLQMAVHVPWLWKVGIRPVTVDWRHPALRRFLSLAPAAVVAYAAPAINSFVVQGLALNLGESTASHLAYASRTQQLPIAVFGVSVATAVFPTLSRHAAAKNSREVINTLAYGLRVTGVVTLAAAVFFMVMPTETIRLLFERGRFNASDTQAVALALYCYSWAILPAALYLITARTFFSEKDTRSPAVIGVASVVSNYTLAVIFSKLIGFEGLVIANSTVVWLALTVSVVLIQRKHASEISLLKSIGLTPVLQMLAAAVAEAFALIAYRKFVEAPEGTGMQVLFMLGAMLTAAVVYLGVLKLLGNRDVDAVFSRVTRRR